MPKGRDLWLLLPAPVRRLPADLAAVITLVVLTDLVVVLPGISETPLRIFVGLPFVLFLPGYAFVAALFPEAGEGPTGSSGNENENENTVATESDNTTAREHAGGRDRGIDGIERVALSFGLSIAIVPLIGLVLNFTPWGIRLVPILLSVSVFTLGAAIIAAQRRWELREDEQFRVPYREWGTAVRAEFFDPASRTDAALNVLLALSIILALASVSYAVAVPQQGERFTEFYLLTENDEGELVADEYPTEFVRGESKPLVVGVTNQEHEAVNYVVLAKLQRVQSTNNSTTVTTERTLNRFSPQLAHNETWQRPYNVTPTMTGTRLRLAFLLYKDSPPLDPTVENAYREVHLWVNVSA